MPRPHQVRGLMPLTLSIVFIEVKKTYVMGKGRLDVIAQVLAECAGMSDFSLFWLQLQILTTLLILACDYVNSKYQCYNPHRYDPNYKTSITAKIEPHG